MPRSTDPRPALVTVNCPTPDSAEAIATAAIEADLAAAARIAAAQTLYRWEGEICDTTEYELQLKTLTDRVGAALELIASMHEYELPSIWVSQPASVGPGVAHWLAESLSGPRRPANSQTDIDSKETDTDG